MKKLLVGVIAGSLSVSTLLVTGGSGAAASPRPSAPSESACGQAGPVADLFSTFALGEAKALVQANGITSHDFEDGTLWTDGCDNVFYKDVGNAEPVTAQSVLDTSAQAADPKALSKTFKLNSKKNAKKTIYLDFNGATVKRTEWNRYVKVKKLVANPYTLDASPNFSAAELAQIQQIWLGVAEDYAAFDVNVTTKKPKAANLMRSSKSDRRWGLTVLVTNTNQLLDKCVCGGIAYLNRAKTTGRQFKRLNYAWAFTGVGEPYKGTGFNSADLANTASHEAGHNLGLKHDGYGGEEYFNGSNPWAPIMGTGYGRYITQFSRGEYNGATNRRQNDVKIITKSFGKRKDDFFNSAKKVNRIKNKKLRKRMTLKPGKGRNGYITSSRDKDVLRLKPGTYTVYALGNYHGNLDIKLSVVNKRGKVLASANPAAGETGYGTGTGLSAALPVAIPRKGKYFIVVDGVGQGNPKAAGGYSAYGSLGEYRLVMR